MELFDKKYVHFMWDDTLEGKKVITAEAIDSLISLVNRGVSGTDIVREAVSTDCPFYEVESHRIYRFVYYDPYYEVKKAYVKGKKIQYKYRAQEEWHDVQNENDFNMLIRQLSDCSNRLSLRIKPEELKRMTYRQLAEWLAKGNGEYRPNRTSGMAYTTSEYRYDCTLAIIPEDYEIRRWGFDEWIEPTEDVYNADCITKECE